MDVPFNLKFVLSMVEFYVPFERERSKEEELR